MNLETDRMLLRDFENNDLDDLYEIFSNPKVMQYVEPPYTLEKTESFLLDFCINRNPKGGYAAVLKETNKVIGYILFKPVDEQEIFEIGWIFNKNYWRHGYAYEVCSELIKYGFTKMNLHKICAETIDTVKSVSLMKKLGMKEEGVQRKHTRNHNGNWVDLHWYAILYEDFLHLHDGC